MLEGKTNNAYALIRAPGHHALPDTGYGFCIFNNIAIAVRHALAVHNLERIAIVDWDVHHGNGNETIFYAESQVLNISIHQDQCFPPDSGHIIAQGEGKGEGYNINIPLPPGSGHAAYLAACKRVVIPALRHYKPDLIIIASGFDASYFDPLGRMMAWSETYRLMTRMLREVANDCCQGRLVACHEGGYSEAYVPFCGLAVIEELCGVSSGLADPYRPICEAAG